jgi:hypothetical protein
LLCFQLSDDTKEDKSKKKKRLDDIMLGLGAAKGVNLDDLKTKEESQSLLKSSLEAKVPELNKLQDLLGRPGKQSFLNLVLK